MDTGVRLDALPFSVITCRRVHVMWITWCCISQRECWICHFCSDKRLRIVHSNFSTRTRTANFTPWCIQRSLASKSEQIVKLSRQS